ncbi:MAG: DUF4350 domain-containing protein [Asgard group archaeon]|nr:DUF4350 domain-containing protein [Asgard group archaeon]
MEQTKDKKNGKFDRNAFLLSVLFIIFCLPIALSVTHIGQEGSRQFSIYNESWDGTSALRENLEGQGYEFRPIVSTLNTLTRVDTMGVLLILGPTIFFDPTETAALAYYIMRGGSVLLADDFGRANDILGLINTIINPFIESINITGFGVSSLPLAGLKFNESLLMDAQSYYASPVMPIIRNFINFPGGPSISGVSSVITSYPTSISFLGYDASTGETQWVPNFSYNGTVIPSGMAVSSSSSWLETNIDDAKNGEYYPDDYEWQGVPFTVMLPLPLGAAGLGNIFLCSDPSIFINDLMDTPYDNMRLAENVINWLDWNNSGIVYYDESHLASAGGRAFLSIFDPFSYIQMYLRYVDSFTMFPLLAPLFPIITFIMLKRRYPKTKGPSPLLMTKIKQSKSRSFFADKMTWYMNYQEFGRALNLLYKRLIRRLMKKYNLAHEPDVPTMVELFDTNFPNEFDKKELEKVLTRIELVSKKSRKVSDEEFTVLVLIIKNLESKITRPVV